MAKRPTKRPRDFFSVESLREEVNEEISSEDSADTILTELGRINLKRVGNVLPDVFFFALIVKFGLSFICQIAYVASSLLLLPVEVSVQVIKILRPQLDDDEAACILQSLGRLVNFEVPDVMHGFHVFSPPCRKCLMCHNDLVKYNEPVVVDYFHLLGKSKGVKVSLKCNRCDVFYGYTKYGNPNSGWKLYPAAREAVEASDICFVERTLLKWQTSLA